jgi:hypothetical protein
MAIKEFKIVTLWPSCDTITGRSSMELDMHFGFALALVLELLAVVGVFVEIPFVSNYALWVSVAAFVILASSVTIIKT